METNLRKIHGLMASHLLVTDPSIPNEKCNLFIWVDSQGEHVYRFLKEKPQKRETPLLLKQLKEEYDAKKDHTLISFEIVQRILEKNLSHTGLLMSVLADFQKGNLRLESHEKPTLIVVCGPYSSGKTFIMEIIKSFVGSNKIAGDSDPFRYLPRHTESQYRMRKLEGKELLIFPELCFSEAYDDIVWEALVEVCRRIPVLVCLNEKQMKWIPSGDDSSRRYSKFPAVMIQTKGGIDKSERDMNLMDCENIHRIVETIRDYIKSI